MSAEVLASPPPGRPEWVVTTKSCWLELGVTTNFSHVHGVEANAVRQAVGDSLRRLQTGGTPATERRRRADRHVRQRHAAIRLGRSSKGHANHRGESPA